MRADRSPNPGDEPKPRWWGFRSPLIGDWAWWVALTLSLARAGGYWVRTADDRVVTWTMLFVYKAQAGVWQRFVGATLTAISTFGLIWFVSGVAREWRRAIRGRLSRTSC